VRALLLMLCNTVIRCSRCWRWSSTSVSWRRRRSLVTRRQLNFTSVHRRLSTRTFACSLDRCLVSCVNWLWSIGWQD